MAKGIVMEIRESCLCVMTSEGEFLKIPLAERECQVGEEINFTVAARKTRRPLFAVTSSVAAVAAVLIILSSMMTGTWGMGRANGSRVVAYVTIDINPSIEMGIDSQQIVRQMRGLNEDGVHLIQNISFAGKSVDDMTAELMVQAEPGYLAKGADDIVISSTLENSSAAAKVDDVALSDQLKTVVTHHIAESHPQQADQFQVTAFAAPKELRDEAKAAGLSTGKYAIYLAAKNNGLQIPLEEYKQESIHTIAEQNGGSGKLIQTQDLTKDKLSELAKDEKDGKLDTKFAQGQKERDQQSQNSRQGKGKQDQSGQDQQDRNGQGQQNQNGQGSQNENGQHDGGHSSSSGHGKGLVKSFTDFFTNLGKHKGQNPPSTDQSGGYSSGGSPQAAPTALKTGPGHNPHTSQPGLTSRPGNHAEPKQNRHTPELKHTLRPQDTPEPKQTPHPQRTFESKQTPQPQFTSEPENTPRPRDLPEPRQTVQPQHTTKPKFTLWPRRTVEPLRPPYQQSVKWHIF